MLNTQLHKYYGNFKQNDGFLFRTYAPNVDKVYIKIDEKKFEMSRVSYDTWEVFVEKVKNKTKYYILIEKDDEVQKKSDPFATFVKIEAVDRSEYGEPVSYTYHSKYQNVHKNRATTNEDMRILEVFLEHVDGKTFQQKAKTIIERAQELDIGFTHIQIMPVHTHSFVKSLGYKTSSPFSVNYRFGEPDDFKEMVDMLHSQGFGVLIDFVILESEEYVKYGLYNYAFQPIFTRDDEMQHDLFTGYLFDLHDKFQREYLLSAMNNLMECGVDGFRMDGINELIFHDDRKNMQYDLDNLLVVREFFQHLEEPIIIIENITALTNELLQIPNIDFVENSMAMYDIRNVLQTSIHIRPEFRLQMEFDNKAAFDEKEYALASINHDVFITGAGQTMRRPYGLLLVSDDAKLPKAISLVLKAVYSNKHRKMIYFDFDDTDNKSVQNNFINYTKVFDKIIPNQTYVDEVVKRQVGASALYHYKMKDGTEYLLIFNLTEGIFKLAIEGVNIYETFDIIYKEAELTFVDDELHIGELSATILKLK